MSFFIFLRALFQFITVAVFKEGELRFNESTFNPVKIVMISLLIMYVIFSIVFMYKLFSIYVDLETTCPGITRAVVYNEVNEFTSCKQ